MHRRPEAVSGDGLVYGHAYSLLEISDNVAGTGIDLVQLRNPWGSGEWTGDWSDNSVKWQQYPQVKAALHEVAKEDGMFWMEKTDFFGRFDSIFVCLSTEAIAERQKWRGKQDCVAQPSGTTLTTLSRTDHV